MVGMPGFWARFLALDRTGGGCTRVFGDKIQFCRFYQDGKYSFAGSTGSKNTVLQFHPEKEIKTYFGPKYFLFVIFFNPLNPVIGLL